MRTPLTHDKQTKGQALVEMAIILPLLLLLVLGIFEFGRAMYIKNTLTQAARAGARAAVVTPDITPASSVTPNSDCIYADPSGNDRVYQAVCTSLYSGIIKTDVRINLAIADDSMPSGIGAGDTVTVEVVLNNYRTKYRVIPYIPLPNTLDGTTAMRHE